MQKFKSFETSSVWEFIDPDTGYVYKADSRAALIRHVITYRIQNKLEPLPFITDVVDNYLCGLPANTGKCEPLVLRRGVLAYIKGGIALLNNLYYGENNMVPQATADARAEQCVTCKFNSFPDKSTFVKWSDDLAEASTGGKKAASHTQLGNCMACSCCLKAKVWYKGPFIVSTDEVPMMQEVGCWQIKNDSNS